MYIIGKCSVHKHTRVWAKHWYVTSLFIFRVLLLLLLFHPGNLRGAQPSYQNYNAQPAYQQPAPQQAYQPQSQEVPQQQQPQQTVPSYNNNYNNINYVAQYQSTTPNPRVHHPGNSVNEFETIPPTITHAYYYYYNFIKFVSFRCFMVYFAGKLQLSRTPDGFSYSFNKV